MKKIILILAIFLCVFNGFSQLNENILKLPKDTSQFKKVVFANQLVRWTDSTIVGYKKLYSITRNMTATQSIRTAIDSGWVIIMSDGASSNPTLQDVTNNDSITTRGATFGNTVNLGVNDDINGSMALRISQYSEGSYGIYNELTGLNTSLTGIYNLISTQNSYGIYNGIYSIGDIGTYNYIENKNTIGTYNDSKTLGAIPLVNEVLTCDTLELHKKNKIVIQRSNSDGSIVSPTLTIAQINSRGGKTHITKDYGDTTYIPYSGAYKNIDLNAKNITNTDTIKANYILPSDAILNLQGGVNSKINLQDASEINLYAEQFFGFDPTSVNSNIFRFQKDNSTIYSNLSLNDTNNITDVDTLEANIIISPTIGEKLDTTTFWNQNNILKEPTGFTNNENITITYDTLNRTITLNGTFEVYYKGKLVPILTNGWVSSPHGTTINKTYFLKYTDVGFIFDTIIWDFSDIQIASCQYFSSQKIAIRETHNLQHHLTHLNLHQTVGTYLETGGDLSDYILNSTTATDRRPIVSTTYIRDEDLKSTISLLNTKLYTQRYLVGTTPTRTFTTGATEMIPVSGNRPYWNQNTGGTWGQTLFNGNEYGAIFLVAIPATSDNSSQVYRYMWVQPQQVSTTLSTIQALTPNNLTHGEASSLVSEYVFISKIIIRYVAGGTDNWSIISVEKLTGNRIQQVALAANSNYITVVNHNNTLIGSGTTLDPLGVDTTIIVTIKQLNDSLTKSNQIITRGFNSITTNDTLFPTGNYGQNEYYVTALAENTLVLVPSGTAFNGNVLMIRITPDATPRNLTWNAIYTSFAVTLPSITIASKSMIVGFIYNSTSSKWECVSVVNQL